VEDWRECRRNDRAAFKRLYRFICMFKVHATKQELSNDLERLKRVIASAEEAIKELED